MKALFHPNGKIQGHMLSFGLESKKGKLYLKFKKQTSAKAFEGGKEFNISLNEIELGGILNVLEQGGEWSAFHDNGEKGGTSIKFSKYSKEDKLVGYSFQVSPKETDVKYGFLFTPAEARSFRSYLEFVLDRFFSATYAEEKKRKDEYFKNKETQKETPAPEEKELAPEQAPTTASEESLDDLF